MATVAGVYPFVSPARRLRLKQLWSRQLLEILGIRLTVRGEVAAGALLVANHISWVDIYVINAARPTGFVSKSEIRAWPLIGWLAAKTDTLFIERGRHRHAQHIAHEMSKLLKNGHSIAVFPEGTTSDGTGLLPFHAALLQPAISAEVPLQALAITYRDSAGARTTIPAYVGETSFAQCLSAILDARGLEAELVCLRPLSSPLGNRRALAAAAEEAIHAALFAPGPDAEALAAKAA